MATTTFINNQTVIVADWLNDVNTAVYDGESFSGILNGTTLALQTGGIDAVNIDAAQKVSIGNLEVTNQINFANNAVIDGAVTFNNGITFADSTIQTTAAYMGANNCLYENNQTVLDNYTVTAGRSASSVGPVTVAVGKSVTLPSGSRWIIL